MSKYKHYAQELRERFESRDKNLAAMTPADREKYEATERRFARERLEYTNKLRAQGGRPPIQGTFGNEASLPAPSRPATTSGAAAPPVAAVVSQVAQTTGPDSYIAGLQVQLAAKNEELAATMRESFPEKDHEFINSWIENANDCKSEFGGNFAAYAAFCRHNGSIQTSADRRR